LLETSFLDAFNRKRIQKGIKVYGDREKINNTAVFSVNLELFIGIQKN